MKRLAIAAAAAAVAAGAAHAAGRELWPAPPDPMRRALLAGLVPARAESLTYHAHAHVRVFVDAREVVVPAGLGIDTSDPAVRRTRSPDGSFAYGQKRRCRRPCISPLHTHDATGIVHVEAPEELRVTLGQLFDVWGVRLDRRCAGPFCGGVRVYVDRTRFRGDPRSVELLDGLRIVVAVGRPPKIGAA